MNTERPVDPQEVQALRAQIEACIAAGEDRAHVDFAGFELLLKKEPDGHYTIGPPGGQRGFVFAAAAAVPEGYPADVPFIANETVAWSAAEGGWNLTWLAPRLADWVIDQLHEHCLDTDWALASETRTDTPTSLQRMYRRGAEQRFVSCSSGSVALVHKLRRLY